MKLAFIGTGIFSSAVAIDLAQNKKNKIMMWTEDEKLAESFCKNHKLDKIWPKKEIPENINLSSNYEEVLQDADVVFIIPAIKYLKKVCLDIQKIINKNVPVIIGTKGIEEESGKFAIEIATKILNNPCYLLTGPNLAKDVVNSNLIGYSLSSNTKKGLKTIKNVLNEDNIVLEVSNDPFGMSICSVLKNIYTIGAGILDGLGNGDSTNAFYINLVFKELEKALMQAKSSYETLFSFGGFGDLVATCSASTSRNFTYGTLLGKGKNKKEIAKFVKENTIEGLTSLEAMRNFLKKKHISLPIFETIYGIVSQNKTVKTLTATLKNIK